MTTPIRFFIALFLAGSLTVPAAHADQDYRNADMPTNQPDEVFENQSYDQKLVNKTFNAISNLSTGVLEVPKNVINTTNDSNIFYGLTGGLFKGLLNTVGRLSVGMADLLTAPIPTKPITYPLHAWENGKEDTRYGNIFELDEFQENKPSVTGTSQPTAVASPVVVAPRLPVVDRSAQYDQQTNKKIDTLFKKQMMK